MEAPPDALIISRADIARLMGTADWLEAADAAFRAAAGGKAVSPQPMHIQVPRGGFHVKAASIVLDREYVAVKVNGNFPGNPRETGLPTVQGAIVLADGRDGILLAIIDSIEVTLRRTAAASALAARLMARPDSTTLLVCGCGMQGRAHVQAVRDVLPITRILAWDEDEYAAEVFAREVRGTVVRDLADEAHTAEVIVCCTPARTPYLDADLVSSGTFIAAVGADNPDKSEIAPRLMANAAVVTDSTRQCAVMGDLNHAIAAGVMTEADVRAELAAVLVGNADGRRSDDEIVIFDSTGTGLLDVAASAAIYERSVALGVSPRVALAGAASP